MSSQYPNLFNYDDAHATQMVVRNRCQMLLRVLHPDSTQGIATADLVVSAGTPGNGGEPEGYIWRSKA